MLVGYNHNYRYKGILFHVQTEDGGIKYPQVVTHLFHGGTILISQKTSYADILSINNLEQVLQEMMKDQHREMLRRLKNGEFDDEIGIRLGGAAVLGEAEPAPSMPPPQGGTPKAPERLSPKTIPLESKQPPSHVSSPATTLAVKEASLEDLILSYFMGDQEILS